MALVPGTSGVERGLVSSDDGESLLALGNGWGSCFTGDFVETEPLCSDFDEEGAAGSVGTTNSESSFA